MCKFMPRFLAFLCLILLVSLVAAAPKRGPATAPSSGTGSIKGSVVVDGKPLANATVRLMQPANPDTQPAAPSADGKRQRPARGTKIAETKTDAEGNFTFANLAAGNYLVVANDRATGVAGRQQIAVGDSESATVSITAKPHKAKDGGKKHKN